MDKRAATGFGLRALIMSMLLALVTACGGGSGGGGAVVVLTIDVTPGNATLAKGVTQDYTAMGNMSDGTRQNLTTQVAWSSVSPAIASITASGRATANTVGTSTIRAIFDGVTGSTQVTVGPAVLREVRVTSPIANIPKGTKQQLTASGIATDGTPFTLGSVAWSSNNTDATISSTGLVDAKVVSDAAETITITATSGGISGTLGVKVVAAALSEIQISPPAPSVAAGLTTPLTATGVFTDGSTSDVTNSVTWTSATPAVATVSAVSPTKGLVTGVATGTAEILAVDSGVTGRRNVLVTAAEPRSLSVTPANASFGKGSKVQYTATLTLSDNSTSDVTTSAEWTATNVPPPVTTPPTPAGPTVATIGRKSGLATAQNPGDTVIKATFSTFSAQTNLKVTAAGFKEIQITPTETNYPLGFEQQLTATSIQTDGVQTNITMAPNAKWTSSNTAVATVSANGGLVKAVSKGTAIIKITQSDDSFDEDRVASLTITVGDATLASIRLEPSTAVSVPQGRFTQQFKAVGVYTDSTTREVTAQALWTSSAETTASISNVDATKGLATSSQATPGPTNITAKIGSVTSPATVLTVTAETLAGIDVEPANETIGLGNTLQYKAIARFTGGSDPRDITSRVTWASSAPAVATISNADGSKGLAVSQSISATPTTISATLGSGTTATVGSTPLRVSDADLVSVEIAPAEITIPKTYSRPLQAIGTYSDGRVEDVTNKMTATWLSSSAGIATVSNAAGAKGVVRGGAPGSATITLTITENDVTVSDTTAVTITNAELESISISPSAFTLPKGLDQQFRAVGTFDDDFVMDLTTQVSWASADTNVATIGDTVGTKGLLEAQAVGGPIAITATKTNPDTTKVIGSTNVTVLLAAVESIAVRPDSQTCGTLGAAPELATLPRPFSLGLIACATYSDSVVRNVTSQVQWTSSNSNVVTVGDSAPNKGIVSPVTDTRTTVNAQLGAVRDSIAVEVNDAVLNTITVTPTGASIFNATPPTQFVATGAFAGGFTLAITRHVTWASSSDTVSISNAAGTQGQATPARSPAFQQEVTISATRGAIKGEVVVTRRANPPAP